MKESLSKPQIAFFIFLLLGFAVYSRALNGEFLYDDSVEIRDNPNTHHVFPLKDSMFGFYQLPVRPIPYLTFAINYELHGEFFFGFHFVNVFIHIINAFLIWLIILGTIGLKSVDQKYKYAALPIAYLVTLTWLVHPVVAIPVNYIYQRMESMMSMFMLLTLYSAIQYFRSATELPIVSKPAVPQTPQQEKHSRKKRDNHKWQTKDKQEETASQDTQANLPRPNQYWVFASFIFCILGVLSKEVMFVAPVLVLWYDRVFVARSFKEIFASRLFLHAGLFMSWIVLFGLILWQKENYPEHYQKGGVDSLGYALTQTRVILWYIRIAFWPDHLCFEYSMHFAKSVAEIIPSSIVILLLLAITAYIIRKYPQAGFVIGIFFLILGPTSSFKPVLSPLYEHRMYLPVMGLILLVMVIIVEVLDWMKFSENQYAVKKTIIASCLMLIGLLGYVNWNRGIIYSSAQLCWEDTMNKEPNNFRAFLNLSDIYLKTERYEDAITMAEKSIALEDENPKARHNMAVSYVKLGIDNKNPELEEKGIRLLYEILEKNPDADTSARFLGNYEYNRKNYKTSLELFEKAIKANPNFSAAYLGLALTLMELNKDPAIIESHFITAIKLATNPVPVHTNYASFLARQGKMDLAIKHAKIALDLNPENTNLKIFYELLLKEAGMKK